MPQYEPSVYPRQTRFDWVPAASLIRELLHRHSPEVAEAAIIDVANKMRGGYVSSYGSRWIGYLHTVANSTAKEMEENGR